MDAEPLTAYVNGHFVPMAEAMVHIEDRGFQFADGIYEVIACFGGNFLDLDQHLARLQRSLDAVAIPAPCADAELRELLVQIYQRNPFRDAMVYVQITRGVAARAHLITAGLTPTLVLTARRLPAPSDAKLAQGVVGITLDDIRWKRCDIKSIALLASVLGKQEAMQRDADEAFWLDREGHVLEGCATNLLAVIDGKLVTHPLDHQVLGGITRHMALELADELAITVVERPWKLNEQNLTECMLTSTTNAVLPVCRIDGKPIGDGVPGTITMRLRAAMCKRLAQLSAQGSAQGSLA
ncbi:MAG: aminotransferase class IV [Mariprofundales bacterium]|nr:aminotransferase class IV [Mariprofundales bacterium]